MAAPGVGTWEFRFFPNNSYDYVMKSNLLIVGMCAHAHAPHTLRVRLTH